MKYRKFNKYEKKENRRINVEQALQGEGMYLYENNVPGDLTLPRKTKSGVRVVGRKQQFQGDNYYMQMVRTGELRLIKELMSPQQERDSETMNEEKLILDQPDKVTVKGKTEQVVDKSVPTQRINESEGDAEEVLLNEGPVDDGFVVVSD
jgi:hypothetical protein